MENRGAGHLAISPWDDTSQHERAISTGPGAAFLLVTIKGEPAPFDDFWKKKHPSKEFQAAAQGAAGGAVVGTGLGFTAATVEEILIGVASAF